MVIIHAVQKLLNTSRLTAALYISEPGSGQLLHSWYAKLLPSGFPGKLFVIYVHEPSLLTIICRGKTIQGTWQPFKHRLEGLLLRYRFPGSFVEREMNQMDGYTVSKTSSRSTLSFMNQMVFQLQHSCYRFEVYDSIPLDQLEEIMMGYLYLCGPKATDYRSALKYWQQTIGLPSVK